jgi:beta-fructofuranosidase
VLRLDEHWLWDFWLADDGERHHLFFLKAPRALGDPQLRHMNVAVGHAVSDDLRAWTVVDDALAPSAEPAFDDLTTWTGSVVRADDGTWCLFYTGASRAEQGLRQRIGLATSDDLTVWRKHSRRAVVESDPRWYEQLEAGAWHDEAWRDPWVFRDPAGDGWHMLITARARAGAADARGVIGHARSPDLLAWEVQPPVSPDETGFGTLEVPQVEVVDGRPVLLFSCPAVELSAERRAAGERGGVWLLEADDVRGPFDPRRARLLADEALYSGRIVRDRGGEWVLLAFRNHGEDGDFVGELSDPMPLRERYASVASERFSPGTRRTDPHP